MLKSTQSISAMLNRRSSVLYLRQNLEVDLAESSNKVHMHQ